MFGRLFANFEAAVIKSAASAAPRKALEAMIKSAASTASTAAWERQDDGGRRSNGDGRTTDRFGRRPRGALKAVGEAALAADLITA